MLLLSNGNASTLQLGKINIYPTCTVHLNLITLHVGTVNAC